MFLYFIFLNEVLLGTVLAAVEDLVYIFTSFWGLPNSCMLSVVYEFKICCPPLAFLRCLNMNDCIPIVCVPTVFDIHAVAVLAKFHKYVGVSWYIS